MLSKHYDKLLLAAGALVLFVVFAISRGGAVQTAQVGATVSNGSKYEPASNLIQPDVKKVDWAGPDPQSKGPEWRFDIFTPPKIYFNPRDKTWTLSPAESERPALPLQRPTFRLMLVTVEREPYRLQLVGYDGGPENYRAWIEDSRTGKIVRLSAGQTSAEHGFTLTSFEVREVELPNQGGTVVRDRRAVARVRDPDQPRIIQLTDKEPVLLPQIRGLFREIDSEKQPFYLRQGESYEIENARYTVKTLTLSPPAAVLERTQADNPIPTPLNLQPGVIPTDPQSSL